MRAQAWNASPLDSAEKRGLGVSRGTELRSATYLPRTRTRYQRTRGNHPGRPLWRYPKLFTFQASDHLELSRTPHMLAAPQEMRRRASERNHLAAAVRQSLATCHFL